MLKHPAVPVRVLLQLKAQSFSISLKADLCQDINRGFTFSRGLNGKMEKFLF